MCATCHEKADPEFPTQIKLGAKCKDCHGALENVPADWIIEGSPPARIASIAVSGGPEEVSDRIGKDLLWIIEKRGFTRAADASVECPSIAVAVEVFRVREDRFVKTGERVMQAALTVEVKAAGDGTLLLRKRAVSRPEYHADPEEAAINAARDGLTLLSAPIAEALKAAYESSGGGKK